MDVVLGEWNSASRTLNRFDNGPRVQVRVKVRPLIVFFSTFFDSGRARFSTWNIFGGKVCQLTLASVKQNETEIRHALLFERGAARCELISPWGDPRSLLSCGSGCMLSSTWCGSASSPWKIKLRLASGREDDYLSSHILGSGERIRVFSSLTWTCESNWSCCPWPELRCVSGRAQKWCSLFKRGGRFSLSRNHHHRNQAWQVLGTSNALLLLSAQTQSSCDDVEVFFQEKNPNNLQ